MGTKERIMTRRGGMEGRKEGGREEEGKRENGRNMERREQERKDKIIKVVGRGKE